MKEPKLEYKDLITTTELNYWEEFDYRLMLNWQKIDVCFIKSLTFKMLMGGLLTLSIQ